MTSEELIQSYMARGGAVTKCDPDGRTRKVRKQDELPTQVTARGKWNGKRSRFRQIKKNKQR